MTRAAAALALALLLAALAPVGAAATAPVAASVDGAGAALATGPSGPPAGPVPAVDESRIVELLPNPVAAGDAGEYVLVALPVGNWTVDDGESRVTVRQNRAGRVVLTDDPDAPVAPPEGRVVGSGLSLSNAGERVALRRGGPDGPVVDAVEYGRAPEGERWLRWTDPPWRPVGLEPRPPVDFRPTNATAFLLPDAPGPPVEAIRNADRRVLLAGYTFGSERVADELIAAHRRGARVRVLVEGDPVGGTDARQARLLDRLAAGGVEVRVVAGPHARVRFHHAKYAVADGRAVVLTENWKPSGTGGADSRGWGVVLRSPAAADALASLFRADAGWRDAVAWREFRAGRTFRVDEPATGRYPTRHPPADVRVERTTLLTAPGNAEDGVVSVVDAADDRVDVIQPTVADGPLLASVRRAAERGVTVRLLLSNAWYVREENEALAGRLNRWADGAGVPFEARVADPAGRYGKVHAKGVVADDVAVVGSLNWNPTSARENREVVVALEGEAVADYYRESFAADWRASGERGGLRSLSPSLAVAAVAGAAAATLFVRRRFELASGRSGDGESEETGPIG
ncbi:phospholipase D-like domain-containing protein [Halobaculum sp. EA56]|uniref:phospholipase D-like domain-containing protein n=1 Tax=Halobaculum sp. EA56 TaxID=3421648 RepID=UPI003EB94956